LEFFAQSAIPGHRTRSDKSTGVKLHPVKLGTTIAMSDTSGMTMIESIIRTNLVRFIVVAGGKNFKSECFFIQGAVCELPTHWIQAIIQRSDVNKDTTVILNGIETNHTTTMGNFRFQPIEGRDICLCFL